MSHTQQQNIKVIVRVRPLSKKQSQQIQSYESFWQGRKKNATRGKLAQTALNFFTKYHNVRPQEVMKIEGNAVSVCDQEYKNTDRKMRDYAFSDVYTEGMSNINIFQQALKAQVDSVFEGINCTLLAYGITGSGKTFSVFGHPKTDKGLSHLAFHSLFATKNKLQQNGDVRVQMRFSFIQIYNENVRDLLSQDGKKQVTIGEDNKGNITLTDACEISIKSPEQIIQLISTGTAKRTSAATQFNAISSRSHAVLKMNVETIREGQRTVSKLFIIDLAGSEKINSECNRRRNEGSNINRSLLTLGNCINALVQNTKKPNSAHVPYRDSKLTRLLKDSLGGTAKTIMLACISPHPFTLDETITTLNYAERAQGIKRQIIRNVFKEDREVEEICSKCRQRSRKEKENKGEGEGVSSAEKGANQEVQGIFLEICQRLYEDIVDNAREAEQIQRLKPEVIQPCEEFDLILKDNQEQKTRLKQILFKLLNQKTKIVVKQQDAEVKNNLSNRKKIRLSSSVKKQQKYRTEQKQNICTEQFQTEPQQNSKKYDQDNFPGFLDTSFRVPKQFETEGSKKMSIYDSERREESQSVQKPKRRKRSKFEVVPKPIYSASASKATEQRVLTERVLSNIAE